MKSTASRSFFARPRAARGAFAAVLIAALVCGFAAPALAQSWTLGEVICNVSNEVGGGYGFSVSNIISGIAYIAGAILIGYGLIGLKDHMENPKQPPLHQALARMGGGAGLLFLPSMTGWLIDSLYGYQGAGGLTFCGNVMVPATGSSVTLSQLMVNLVYNVKDPFTWMMSVGAVTFGLFLIFRGLVKASKFGTDPRAHSIPVILVNLLVGAVLVTVGQSLGVIMATLFGSNFINPSSDVLGWNAVTTLNASSEFTTAIIAALTFFQLIGLIAFVRGWLIVKNAVEGVGQATMVQGFTHIIGGVLAINIYGFLEVLDHTFGTGFLS
ncbi:MAG TPA: hypothetical protein VMV79_00295 [Alphaproteobacteria bacterium]|nr:hypothetical protein [Alphaproteobacteria bacterium]